MTIEEVMELAENYRYEARAGEVCHRWAELRAALTALVAQARDEEAWACASVVHSAVTGVMTCDANGNAAAEYINRGQTVADIRARIAGRKA